MAKILIFSINSGLTMQRQPARQLSLRAALAHGLATFRVMVSNFKNFAREHGHFDGHWISQEGKAKEWDQFWNKIQTRELNSFWVSPSLAFDYRFFSQKHKTWPTRIFTKSRHKGEICASSIANLYQTRNVRPCVFNVYQFLGGAVVLFTFWTVVFIISWYCFPMILINAVCNIAHLRNDCCFGNAKCV